jgi:hypothetical protein
MRRVTAKRADTLLALMDHIERFTLARAWADLTDDEFFWEPETTTWSIRRRDRCAAANPFGAGEWLADFEIPEPHHGTQIGAMRDLCAWRQIGHAQV